MERHRRVENDSTGTGGVPDGVRDQCVICYTRPEADCRRRRRRVKFLQIHARADENSKLYEFIAELLGFEVCTNTHVQLSLRRRRAPLPPLYVRLFFSSN